MSKTDPFVVHARNSREARSQTLPKELEALKIRRRVILLRVLFFGTLVAIVGLALSLLPLVAWEVIGWIIFGIISVVVLIGHIAGFSFLCSAYAKDARQYKKAKEIGVVEDE